MKCHPGPRYVPQLDMSCRKEIIIRFEALPCRWAFWIFSFFLEAPRGMQSFPDQGLNVCPLQWKHRTPTTGPPGKPLSIVFTNPVPSYGNVIPAVRREIKSGKRPWKIQNDWGRVFNSFYYHVSETRYSHTIIGQSGLKSHLQYGPGQLSHVFTYTLFPL